MLAARSLQKGGGVASLADELLGGFSGTVGWSLRKYSSTSVAFAHTAKFRTL